MVSVLFGTGSFTLFPHSSNMFWDQLIYIQIQFDCGVAGPPKWTKVFYRFCSEARSLISHLLPSSSPPRPNIRSYGWVDEGTKNKRRAQKVNHDGTPWWSFLLSVWEPMRARNLFYQFLSLAKFKIQNLAAEAAKFWILNFASNHPSGRPRRLISFIIWYSHIIHNITFSYHS